MRNQATTRLGAALVTGALAAALAGCAGAAAAEANAPQADAQAEEAATEVTIEGSVEDTQATANLVVATLDNVATGGVLDGSGLFTERDLTQEADLVGATYLSLTSGQDVTVTEAGTYVLVGDVTNVTVIVDADGEKVQLVLDGVSITNDDSPAIYVRAADKVFVTTAEGSANTLQVTGAFAADGDTNTDAVIFSKDDLVLNGLGSLTITSTDNGITSKDDLKVTGGTLSITCQADGLEAHDSVRIAGGDITITTPKDGIHAEWDDDDTVGYVYICGGNITITAGDDGIHGTTYVQVDGGTLTLSAAEAIEATYVQINGGTISIQASDDGINASYKSKSMGTPTIDIRGGDISISMAQGDTDALDANGYLLVSGGTIDISAQFAFDFDLGSEFTGGTIYVNGEQVTEITESMMMGGPGGMGGMGAPGEMGGPGGFPGGPGGGMGGPGGH